MIFAGFIAYRFSRHVEMTRRVDLAAQVAAGTVSPEAILVDASAERLARLERLAA